MSFAVSAKVNPPTTFLARWSEITDRLDPEMVLFRRKAHNFIYPVHRFRDLFQEPPQYGAGERGMERESVNQARYVRITDINEYGILTNELGVTAENIESRFILKENDLLIARSGNTVGKAYLHKKEHAPYTCLYAGYLIRFRFDERIILPEYVFAFTQLPVYKEWVRAVQRPAGQPNINAQEYANLSIPLPPLPIQEKVVLRLRAAYDAKRKSEAEALKLLQGIDRLLLEELGIKQRPEPPNALERRIFKRALSEVTGGRLDPVANQPKRIAIESAIKSGKYSTVLLKTIVSPKNEIVDTINPGDRYIGLENVDSATGRLIDTEDKESVSTAHKFSPRQILFPKLRPYLNKTHLASFPGVCSTEFHVFDVHGVSSEFLTEILRSKLMVSLTSLLMTGNTLPRLQVYDIANLPIPVPPPPVQEMISRQANEIRHKALTLFDNAHAELKNAMSEIESMLLSKGGHD